MPQNDEITDRIKNLIARQFAVDRNLVIESARLFEDLGLDSMDSIELVMALEVEFDGEVPDKDIAQFKTVGDVIQAVNIYFPGLEGKGGPVRTETARRCRGCRLGAGTGWAQEPDSPLEKFGPAASADQGMPPLRVGPGRHQ